MAEASVSIANRKSILRKTATSAKIAVPPNVNIPPPKTDKEAQHLQTALYHAHQVRAQKQAALEILASIEALSLLPSGSQPTAAEARHFTSAVSVFQPSDYTALLEERKVNRVCGYTLCGLPAPEPSKGREWLRREVERRFCSDVCARKAMYVRAQLDETPAWERRGGLGSSIVLLEDRGGQDTRPRSFPHDDEAVLAGERGETRPGSIKVKLVTDDVIEKQTTGRARVGSDVDGSAHDVIEGYKVAAMKHVGHDEDSHPGTWDVGTGIH